MDFHPRPQPQKPGASAGGAWGATMRAAGGKPLNDVTHNIALFLSKSKLGTFHKPTCKTIVTRQKLLDKLHQTIRH